MDDIKGFSQESKIDSIWSFRRKRTGNVQVPYIVSTIANSNQFKVLKFVEQEATDAKQAIFALKSTFCVSLLLCIGEGWSPKTSPLFQVRILGDVFALHVPWLSLYL